MSAGSVDCSLGKEKPFIRVACFNVEHLLPSASFSHIAELGVPCGYQNHFLASSCAERLLLQKKALPAYSREPWPARIIDLMQIINRVLWGYCFSPSEAEYLYSFLINFNFNTFSSCHGDVICLAEYKRVF